MGTVELQQLRKRFGSGDDAVVAVDDLSLELEDGEFLVLVGPSGCGKSTTLRMIAGLESATDGDIRIGRESVTESEPRDRDIAMVFQNYALYPHMTARENMAFGLKMNSSLDDATIDSRVTEVAQTLSIEPLLDDTPSELSGGQQQRVALGRAIVREPAVFLMDEPLSNLDAKLRSQMRTELQALQASLETTTIYVTHDQTEAMTMGDRIAILDEGELQQVGTPLECYNTPANQFVAGFIGSPSMNFLDVTHDDGTLTHEAFTYELSESTTELLEDQTDYVMGVRPEDLDLAPDGAIDADAEVVEPLGDLSHVHTRVGETLVTATVPAGTQLPAGESLTLSVPESRLHIFDQLSGEAIKNSDGPTEEQPLIAAE